MEAKKAKALAAASTVIGLLILLAILRRCLGLSKTFFLITGFTSAAILTILLWLLVGYVSIGSRRLSMARQLAPGEKELRLEYSFLRKVAGLPAKFPYKALEAATDNFQALIGRGSSGAVFKGILDDGTPVAVKCIEGAEHGDKEFQSEISAIASVQHMNLVRLLGYCLLPGGPRYLVYEFITNGSLDSWIFPRNSRKDTRNYFDDNGGQHQCLPWPLRYRVAIDVAKALAYLHHDCRSRVLHLDVKPENILLDDNFRAMVADFGLSKLMGKDESRIVTTVRGTRGYLAPEWLLDRGITEKSDVYSYGMVLMELVGGRRNVRLVEDGGGGGRKWSYFPKIVEEKAREGRVMEVVDERLMLGGVEEKEVRILVWVALWCVQEEGRLRPSMARVVDMLEGRIGVDMPPETEMAIVDLLSIEREPPDGGNGGGGETSAGCRLVDRHTSTYSLAMSVLSGR